MKSLLKITGLLLLAGAADAAEPPAPASGAQPDSVTVVPGAGDAAPALLPPERKWRLGVGLGYGKRSNPLIQSEDIPVLVDVDVAYFGKRWFFDNGDLGLSLHEGDRATTNLVARVNSDRTFFSKTNLKYVQVVTLSGGTTIPALDPETGTPIAPTRLKPPERDYAIELGLETLVDGDWGAATFRAFHDVSGTHDGYEISANYDYRITRGRFSVSPSVGVSYKSDALSNYYWGVHKEEATFVLPRYEARGGLGWEAALRANYFLSKKTRIAVSANYERLEQGVADSPLVSEPYVFGYFAGIAWSF